MEVNKVLPKIHVSFHPKSKASERVYVTGSKEAVMVLRSVWNQDTINLYEEFKVVFLDRGNGIIGFRNFSRGTISSVVVDIRLIISTALSCNSNGIILSHNHPSGQLRPSIQDKTLTTKFQKACKLFDLELLDHIILTSESYFSFSDEDMI